MLGIWKHHDNLSKIYYEYIIEENLPELPIYELLHEKLTKGQRKIVSAFYNLFEAFENTQ